MNNLFLSIKNIRRMLSPLYRFIYKFEKRRPRVYKTYLHGNYIPLDFIGKTWSMHPNPRTGVFIDIKCVDGDDMYFISFFVIPEQLLNRGNTKWRNYNSGCAVHADARIMSEIDAIPVKFPKGMFDSMFSPSFKNSLDMGGNYGEVYGLVDCYNSFSPDNLDVLHSIYKEFLNKIYGKYAEDNHIENLGEFIEESFRLVEECDKKHEKTVGEEFTFPFECNVGIKNNKLYIKRSLRQRVLTFATIPVAKAGKNPVKAAAFLIFSAISIVALELTLPVAIAFTVSLAVGVFG